MVSARNVTALAALVGMLVLGARTAEAQAQRRIYLNGVDLTDTEVTNREFESCTVRFDADGNLHITAPGFEIKKQPAKKPRGDGGAITATPGKLSKSYFLVSEESRRGATRYEVAVYVNGKRVTTIRSNADPAAIDITRFVKPGKNEVRFFATKKKSAKPRKKSSPAAYLEIQVGEGRARADTVTLTKTLLQYKRSASESSTYDHTYRFTAR